MVGKHLRMKKDIHIIKKSTGESTWSDPNTDDFVEHYTALSDNETLTYYHENTSSFTMGVAQPSSETVNNTQVENTSKQNNFSAELQKGRNSLKSSTSDNPHKKPETFLDQIKNRPHLKKTTPNSKPPKDSDANSLLKNVLSAKENLRSTSSSRSSEINKENVRPTPGSSIDSTSKNSSLSAMDVLKNKLKKNRAQIESSNNDDKDFGDPDDWE